MKHLGLIGLLLGLAISPALAQENFTTCMANTNCPVFSSGAPGVTPSSGGGTTNFLRADGSWAAPPTTTLGVETPTFSGGSYTLGGGDSNMRLLVGGQATVTAPDVTLLLPTNTAGSPFPATTTIEVYNQSNATAVPIKYVSSVEKIPCASQCGSTTPTFTFTQVGSGNHITLAFAYCASSGCTGTAGTVTGITDTLGNTCSNVGRAISSPAGHSSELWSCPNSVSSGSDTVTVHLSNTNIWFLTVDELENSGVATASPVDASTVNTCNGTGTTFSCALAAAPAIRGEEIVSSGAGGGNNGPSRPFVPFASAQTASAAYYNASASTVFSATWTAPASNSWEAVMAGLKPANPPVVRAWICQPASGATIYGIWTDTEVCAHPGTEVPPGAVATIRVDPSFNYSVSLAPVQLDTEEIADSSYTFKNSDCYAIVEPFGSGQTFTVPGTLPSPCNIQLTQFGLSAASVVAATGVSLLANGNDAHTGGQFTSALISIGGAGQTGTLSGAIAP
ncbi:MAG TPA: hypothetical protein VGR45_16885 [Stellaceae bacterium]|nr:hypothetical protein [Stellaceae bacterium]